MKLIVLVEGSSKNIEELTDGVADPDTLLLCDTHDCTNEAVEYESIVSSADMFSRSRKEVMVVRFSGNNYIASVLGDELSEMVITLSYNEKSPYYVDNLVVTFFNTLEVLKKGD